MTLHDTQEADHELAPSAAAAPRRPATPGGFSIRPAMVVLGLALLILAVFVTLGIVSSKSPTAVRSGGSPTAVPNSTLRAERAALLLAPIVSSGEPPANILNAVFVPAGSSPVSHQNNSGGSGQFDSQMTFRSGASQAAVLGFFASDMKLQGWQIFDRGPAANDPNALEVLGKLAGTDGYYWEMGATVEPTVFSAGGPARGTTPFTIRLYQEDDEGP
jgi:hypothetical protein